MTEIEVIDKRRAVAVSDLNLLEAFEYRGMLHVHCGLSDASDDLHSCIRVDSDGVSVAGRVLVGGDSLVHPKRMKITIDRYLEGV